MNRVLSPYVYLAIEAVRSLNLRQRAESCEDASCRINSKEAMAMRLRLRGMFSEIDYHARYSK
jgi:hypothetical protein